MEPRCVRLVECFANCNGLPDATLIPDPLDCRQYYICSAEEELGPFSCDPDQIFSEADQKCVTGADCQNICDSACVFECSVGPKVIFDRIPTRADCSSYYECSTDGTLGEKIQCPSHKPFFDGFTCQTEESECCSCKPYCSAEDLGKFVIDPTDCTNRYLCLELGVPTISETCASGNVDVMTVECSDVAPCIVLCTNVVEPDGCIEKFTCEERGYFAKCPQRCSEEFYFCDDDDIGKVVEAHPCLTEDQVFHPDTKRCVDPSECPYPPYFNDNLSC